MPVSTKLRHLDRVALALTSLSLMAITETAIAGDFGSLGLNSLLGSIWSVFGILGSMAALGASFLFYRMANHRALFALIAVLLVSGIISRTVILLLQFSGIGYGGLPMTALNVLSGVMTLVEWGALVIAGVMAFRPAQEQPPHS